MDSWWETPLPLNFLDIISNDINTGKIPLVFLPEHTPEYFFSYFKKVLDKDRRLLFENINLIECEAENDKAVEHLLFKHFELNNVVDRFIQKDVVNIFEFLKSESNTTHEQILIFRNLKRSILESFKKFIIDLGRYHSRLPVHERNKVIVFLEAKNFVKTDFVSETGISKVLYRGIFDQLDYKLGVRYIYNYDADVYTNLNESIIVSLSQFDSKLVEDLVDSNNLIDEYEDILLRYAKEKNWNEIKYKNIDDLSEEEVWSFWAKGILDIKNKKIIYHSAFLKIHEKQSELTKRVWSAGIEILLPLIEELRGEILNCKNILFSDYFENKKEETVKHKMDLEIGEINHFIKTKKIYPKYFTPSEKQKILKYIDTSRNIRNDLSHLRMPKANDIKFFLKEYDNTIKLLKNSD